MGTSWGFCIGETHVTLPTDKALFFLGLLHIPTEHFRLGGHVENPWKYSLFPLGKWTLFSPSHLWLEVFITAKERKLGQCPFYDISRVRSIWGGILVLILYFANGGKKWRTETSPYFVKQYKNHKSSFGNDAKGMTVNLPGIGFLKCLVQRIANTILFIITDFLLLDFENTCDEYGNNGFKFIFPSQPFWNYKLQSIWIKYLI